MSKNQGNRPGGDAMPRKRSTILAISVAAAATAGTICVTISSAGATPPSSTPSSSTSSASTGSATNAPAPATDTAAPAPATSPASPVSANQPQPPHRAPAPAASTSIGRVQAPPPPAQPVASPGKAQPKAAATQCSASLTSSAITQEVNKPVTLTWQTSATSGQHTFGGPGDFTSDQAGDPQPSGSASVTHNKAESVEYVVGVYTNFTNGFLCQSNTVTITYTAPPNQAPKAVLSVSPQSGNAPLPVNADGSQSTDDKRVASYGYSWGDGTPNDSGLKASHTYKVAGTYVVTLTVKDAEGLSSTATKTVTVSNPVVTPPTCIQTADARYDYKAGVLHVGGLFCNDGYAAVFSGTGSAAKAYDHIVVPKGDYGFSGGKAFALRSPKCGEFEWSLYTSSGPNTGVVQVAGDTVNTGKLCSPAGGGKHGHHPGSTSGSGSTAQHPHPLTVRIPPVQPNSGQPVNSGGNLASTGFSATRTALLAMAIMAIGGLLQISGVRGRRRKASA